MACDLFTEKATMEVSGLCSRMVSVSHAEQAWTLFLLQLAKLLVGSSGKLDGALMCSCQIKLLIMLICYVCPKSNKGRKHPIVQKL